MITYYKSYYWLIRFRYFAYTVSSSPWTYPSSGRYSVKFTCCCGYAFAKTVLQSILQSRIFAACVLRIDLQNPGEVFPATCRDWFASQSWRNRLDFAFALLSTGSFAPIVKWSTRPHGLFTLPAALHAWKRTCHFKHCSYVIFTSNTDGIRGVSIVKKYCSYMSLSLPANISLRFCKHWYMCNYTATFIIIIWAYGFLQGYIGWHSWLNIGKIAFI